MSHEEQNNETNLTRAYKRAAIGLAVAAAIWFLAYLYARKAGWEEQSLIIPIAAAALSVLCYSLYLKSKQ
ncbi:MAG TPA: hypothetical protein VFD58_33925 [Blastocatellia bacterium]|nr:hypothetical protein [Blastocatellia bacterium]